MKDLEEAATDYVYSSSIIFPEEAVKKAFKAGAEFTQRWISVDDELPNYYQIVLADNGKYMAVVARVSDGDEDFYPICGTNVYMSPNPIKWWSIKLNK